MKNKGQELYKKAKKIIPGGTMLFSKRPELFLPDIWPSYFSKAKGCNIWDLENKKFYDVSLMGVGTNSLGYSNVKVDNAVLNTIKRGNMSTLNCPEEVYLAEKLLEINPWADMVRFSRTGGEANSIAIRIARAASGRDKVAICGYHGWHDWYLSLNHNKNEDNLSEHLLSGLNPSGVPKNLKNTVYPFSYNNLKQLKNLVINEDIGVIKMEVQRNHPPKDNFLQKVRKLATENNIVLIFDECTSGFRETYGGLCIKYKVEPDIIIFGKALGNGYAINAIVGKRNVMESAQKSFISSTFWTERIGPTAALKTLEIMKKINSWEIITKIGKSIVKGWEDLAKSHKLEINVEGLPSIASYSFNSSNNLKYKTFITQEMLKKGFLASTNFYSSVTHKKNIINIYFEYLNEIYFKIKKCEDQELNINKLLDGPVSHSGFKRLN